jgi:hypothetical protein
MYNFVITGSDAESFSIQVLVHSCNMLRRKHPNGCCRSGNEQGKSDLAVEMEHEFGHNCLLGKPYTYIPFHIYQEIKFVTWPSILWILVSYTGNTQHGCKVRDDSWVVTQRGPTYPSMFCAVPVFTTILDSLLLGHDMSVGRYTSNYSKTLIIKYNKKPRIVILLLKSKMFMFILFKSSSEA